MIRSFRYTLLSTQQCQFLAPDLPCAQHVRSTRRMNVTSPRPSPRGCHLNLCGYIYMWRRKQAEAPSAGVWCIYVVMWENSVPQWGAETSVAGQWLSATGGDGVYRVTRTGLFFVSARTIKRNHHLVRGVGTFTGARSGLPCPVPACCCRGCLAGAGSGSHSGVELWRSRTGKGSSGGRKKGLV